MKSLECHDHLTLGSVIIPLSPKRKLRHKTQRMKQRNKLAQLINKEPRFKPGSLSPELTLHLLPVSKHNKLFYLLHFILFYIMAKQERIGQNKNKTNKKSGGRDRKRESKIKKKGRQIQVL